MSILIFALILGALIFVHELGHFIVAKKTGMRVDEFAVGFPPKILSFKKGGTQYSLNLIPFGGYVKIFGENPDEESLSPEVNDSFVNKSRWSQAAVLVAGVTFNVIFAWLLLSLSFFIGTPTLQDDLNRDELKDVKVTITEVLEGSPAQEAGIQLSDKIISLTSDSKEEVLVEEIVDVQNFVADHSDEKIDVLVKRGGQDITLAIVPEDGIVEGRKALGISMNYIGLLKLPLHQAISEGFLKTGELIKDVSIGLFFFLKSIFIGEADLNSVSGPVGIVGLVDSASHFGVVYLLVFTALISINLAVLNLVPFPALDGGRLLFLAIEGIIQKRIKPSVFNIVNAIGFIILIILMIVITISDVLKLF